MTALDAAPSLHPPCLAFGGQRLLLPQRTQVEVVLQQLPLLLPAPGPGQIFQLIVGHPPGLAAGKVLHQCSKQIRDPVKGSGAAGVAYGSIGLFFLVRIRFAPSNLSARK